MGFNLVFWMLFVLWILLFTGDSDTDRVKVGRDIDGTGAKTAGRDTGNGDTSGRHSGYDGEIAERDTVDEEIVGRDTNDGETVRRETDGGETAC